MNDGLLQQKEHCPLLKQPFAKLYFLDLCAKVDNEKKNCPLLEKFCPLFKHFAQLRSILLRQ